MKDIKEKRKKITDLIVKTITLMEPKANGPQWKTKLENMTDEEFDFFMRCLKEEKEVIMIYTPNMKIHLQFENIEKASKHIGLELFQHLKIKDSVTGVTFVTTNKCLLLELPIRRMQQTVYEKLSIPIDDKKIDGLTGQVTGDDRACSITYPEIQALKDPGFKSTLDELVVARGGNLNAYAKLKQDLEDMGEGSIDNSVDDGNISRSTVILDVLLNSMGYETNLITER